MWNWYRWANQTEWLVIGFYGRHTCCYCVKKKKKLAALWQVFLVVRRVSLVSAARNVLELKARLFAAALSQSVTIDGFSPRTQKTSAKAKVERYAQVRDTANRKFGSHPPVWGGKFHTFTAFPRSKDKLFTRTKLFCSVRRDMLHCNSLKKKKTF